MTGKSFGGLGGVTGGRERDDTDEFENAIERAFGEALRSQYEDYKTAQMNSRQDQYEEALGARLWCALANRDWLHDSGDDASYSFRAAGDLIAAVIGKGDYMDWYCARLDYGTVSEDIEAAMAKEGWHPQPMEEDGA